MARTWSAVAVLTMMVAFVGSPAAYANSDQVERGVSDEYRLIDLGTLGGSNFLAESSARGVNDRGEVVGYSNTADFGTHPFLWRAGQMIDLGVLGPNGLEYSAAEDVNNSGDVVGASRRSDGEVHAFLWRDGQMIDLGTLGGTYSEAVATNDRAEIVGVSERADGSWSGFLWRAGKMIDLGFFPYDINNRGHVTGSATTGQFGETSAVRWQDGDISYLRQAEGSSMIGVAINNRDEILVSASVPPANYEALLWRQETSVNLGSLGSGYTSAIALNDHGQVVGISSTAANEMHAFIWDNGTTFDLTTRGIAAEFGLVPFSINNRGLIVGNYRSPSGRQHAVAVTRYRG